MKTPNDIKPLQLVRALERLGFVVQHSHSGHCKLKHPDGRFAQIPVHQRTVPVPTLKDVLKETKLALADLLDNLR